LSCLVLSCLVLSCLVLSCLVLSCLVLWLVVLWFVVWCLVWFCFVLSLFCIVSFCLYFLVLSCLVLSGLVWSRLVIVSVSVWASLSGPWSFPCFDPYDDRICPSSDENENQVFEKNVPTLDSSLHPPPKGSATPVARRTRSSRSKTSH
jgi:hypothetical protein